jgi:hypothetical protein
MKHSMHFVDRDGDEFDAAIRMNGDFVFRTFGENTVHLSREQAAMLGAWLTAMTEAGDV